MDRTKARNIALRCSVVLVAIGMLVYMIHYSLGQFSTTLSTLPTQEITDYTILSAEVYVFRDEQVIRGESDAPVHYMYRDGERVPRDAVYAVTYPKAGAPATDVAALQQRLDDIGAQIALLEDSDKAGSLITSLKENQASIKQSYYRVLNELSAGIYFRFLCPFSSFCIQHVIFVHAKFARINLLQFLIEFPRRRTSSFC